MKCLQCGKGNFSKSMGSNMCDKCEPGKYLSTTGQSACERCRIGSFTEKDGSVTCTLCPGNRTTEYPGVVSEERCVCPEKTYRALNGVCVTCPEGMTCGLASAQALFPTYAGEKFKTFEQVPKLNPGFYSTSKDPKPIQWRSNSNLVAIQ